MDTVSAATVVGVRVIVGEGIVVGVRVAVGGKVEVGVAEGPVAVGKGCVGARVGVRVVVGAETCLITNDRTEDHAPFVPLAVRPRTRHQKVRSLLRVWVVWVCVMPVRERTGELNVLASSIWIWYVAAPATGFHEKVML